LKSTFIIENNVEILANGHVIASEFAAQKENCSEEKVRVAIPSVQGCGSINSYTFTETNPSTVEGRLGGVPPRKGKVPVHKGEFEELRPTQPSLAREGSATAPVNAGGHSGVFASPLAERPVFNLKLC